MDKAGDWIYIILIALAGISSFISSAKEKKRKQKANQAKPFGQAEEMQPNISLLDNKKTDIKKPPIPTIERFISQNSAEIKARPEMMPIHDSEEPQLSESFHQEELRKAVIYTEILNRKY